MINVFIIGSRGYTKRYGGWETLVHGLVDNQINPNIHYYIYEVVSDKKDEGIFEIDTITCIKLFVKTKKSGFQMIFCDAKALFHATKYIKKNKIENPILLTLGARVGPLLWLFQSHFKSSKAVIMDNPGGVEWKRPKWGLIGEWYTYLSCYFTGIASDNIVCDSEGIRTIYKKMIKSPKHIKDFAAYGVYPIKDYDPPKTKEIQDYFERFDIKENDYYLIINRFMPENSYELILSEFLQSDTKKKLVLVTNIDTEKKYYDKLQSKLHFQNDPRIIFVGTLYNSDILLYLRLHAFCYINGHTLGGTNPGLLEAMFSTGFVMAYDVVFSREVCDEYAFYFDEKNKMRDTIKKVESIDDKKRKQIVQKARKRMANLYSWNKITSEYEEIFEKAITKRMEKRKK